MSDYYSPFYFENKFNDSYEKEIHRKQILVEQIIKNESKNLHEVISINKELVLNSDFHLNSEENDQIIPKYGLTLAHIAAFYDSLECLIELIKAGIDVDVKSTKSYTPLMYACASASVECATYLLCKKASPNVVSEKYLYNPLFLATYSGSVPIIEMLFDFGADMTVQVEENPLTRALKSKHIDCLEVLLRRGYKPTARDGEMSPLMQAIANHLDEAVKPLLERGADVNYSNKKGNNALILAARRNNIKIVETLLQYGAKVNCSDEQVGNTPIHLACSNGNIDMVKLLVRAGGNIKKTDKKGRSALFSAINSEYDKLIPILEYLIDSGLNLNQKDSDDATILTELIPDSEKAKPDVLKFLFEKGARINIRNESGRTAYDLAKAFFSKGTPERELFDNYAASNK